MEPSALNPFRCYDQEKHYSQFAENATERIIKLPYELWEKFILPYLDVKSIHQVLCSNRWFFKLITSSPELYRNMLKEFAYAQFKASVNQTVTTKAEKQAQLVACLESSCALQQINPLKSEEHRALAAKLLDGEDAFFALCTLKSLRRQPEALLKLISLTDKVLDSQDLALGALYTCADLKADIQAAEKIRWEIENQGDFISQIMKAQQIRHSDLRLKSNMRIAKALASKDFIQAEKFAAGISESFAQAKAYLKIAEFTKDEKYFRLAEQAVAFDRYLLPSISLQILLLKAKKHPEHGWTFCQSAISNAGFLCSQKSPIEIARIYQSFAKKIVKRYTHIPLELVREIRLMSNGFSQETQQLRNIHDEVLFLIIAAKIKERGGEQFLLKLVEEIYEEDSKAVATVLIARKIEGVVKTNTMHHALERITHPKQLFKVILMLEEKD